MTAQALYVIWFRLLIPIEIFISKAHLIRSGLEGFWIEGVNQTRFRNIATYIIFIKECGVDYPTKGVLAEIDPRPLFCNILRWCEVKFDTRENFNYGHIIYQQELALLTVVHGDKPTKSTLLWIVFWT